MSAEALDALGAKLGHGLEEIRVRALDALLSKLSSGVVPLSALLHRPALLATLVQWRGPRSQDLLSLLSRLAPLIDLDQYGTPPHLPASNPHPPVHNAIVGKAAAVPRIDRRPPPDTATAPAWRFPFVSLPRSDERLLFDLSVRMKSRDSALQQSALLEFRRDFLPAFPAEIFLQRPATIAALVDLIGGDADHLVADVIEGLVRGLRSSMRLYSDPSARPAPMPHDGDVEETQYPPRGRPDDCRYGGVRSHLSVAAFSTGFFDAILNAALSVAKLMAYAPVLRDLLTLCEDWSDARLDAFASVLRLHERDPDTLLILLRVVIGVPRLSDTLADMLGDLLCDDDAGIDASIRGELFRRLLDRKHDSAAAYAEASAIVTAMASIVSPSNIADIDRAVDGLAYQEAMLPGVLDAVITQLDHHPTLMSTLRRLILHLVPGIRDRVFAHLTTLLPKEAPPAFLYDAGFLKDVVVYGLGQNVAAAATFLLEACTLHSRTFLPALRPLRGLVDMLASSNSSTSAFALLTSHDADDDLRIAAALRNLFHNDVSVVHDARDILADFVITDITAQWHVDSERVTLAIAPIRAPFRDIPADADNSVTSTPSMEQDARNLARIYANFRVEFALRCSAATQLSRMVGNDGRRYASVLADLRDSVTDQLRASTLDLIDVSVPSDILLPTLRLLFHMVCVGVYADASVRLRRALLPFIFHAGSSVRAAVADIAAVLVFHPASVDLSTLYASPDAPVCSVPAIVPRLFTLCTSRVRFQSLASPAEAAPVNARTARIIAHRLRCTDDAPSTCQRRVITLLERIESATSFDTLMLAASTLQACCAVDADCAVVLRNVNYRAYLERYLTIAPACRDDDAVVVVLLGAVVAAGIDVTDLLVSVTLPIALQRLERNLIVDDDLLVSYTLMLASRDSTLYKPLRSLLAISTRPDYVTAHALLCLSTLPSDVLVTHGDELVPLCIGHLSQNRLPSSFVNATLTRASVTLLLTILPLRPPSVSSLIPDPASPSLRWLWRLITDRESSLRSCALLLFTLLYADPSVADVLRSSAPSGTDPVSSALRYASDKTQAPIVRQSAITFLSTFSSSEDDTVMSMLPTLLRSDIVTPSFWLSVVHLANRLMAAWPDDVIGHLFDHAVSHVIIDLFNPDRLRSRYTAYLEQHYAIMPKDDLWTVLEQPIAVECGLACLTLLDSLPDKVAGRAALHLFGQVVARPDTLGRAEAALAFLLRLDPVTLLPDGDLPLDLVKQLGTCLEAASPGSRYAACQLLIMICRVTHNVDSTVADPATELLLCLTRLLLAAQARHSYYAADSVTPCDVTDLYAQALAHFASVLPSSCKHSLRHSDTLRLLIDQGDFLADVYVARRLVADNAVPIVADLELIVMTLKALLYRCPNDVKLYALRDLHLAPVLLRLWRLSHPDHDTLRNLLMHLTLNLASSCDPAKVLIANLTKRSHRAGILAGVVDLVPARPALQCLQSFATSVDTLPLLLRAGVVENVARQIRKRTSAPVLWLLASVALTTLGQARVTQVLVPDLLDNVLDACIAAGKARGAAFTLLHNLSFHAPAKTTLLGNARLLVTLLDACRHAPDPNDPIPTLASASLWSLVYDCQKACAMIRQQLTRRRISLGVLVQGLEAGSPVRHNLEQIQALIGSP